MEPKQTVAVIGGGIAGLTVAHELSRTERFDITVYERNPQLGGKARSVRLPDSNVAEHAMRAFMACYSTLFTVMQEVPFEGKTVYDNLVYGEATFRYGDNVFVHDLKYNNLWAATKKAVGIGRFFYRAGVGITEQLLFVYKVGRLLWMTAAKVDDELSVISFEDYVGGSSRSEAFREVVLRIPEMVVAAKRYASAAVVARVFLEWYIGPFLKSRFHRLGISSLNGPTSERFIEPWIAELTKRGVQFRTNVRITDVIESARLIREVRSSEGTAIIADIYVLAVQHNVLDAILSPELKRLIPKLEDLLRLGKEWSNGVQFFLRSIPPDWESTVGRLTVAVDTEWSLVFLITTSDQLWKNVPLPDGVAGVLSVVLSNSRTNGRKHHKPYIRCTKEEVLDETLEQIGWKERATIIRGVVGLDLHYVSSDAFEQNRSEYAGWASAAIPNAKLGSRNEVAVSDGQLYIRLPGNLAMEPDNSTDVYNLFVAGEFTRTEFSSPTMEKSCESAMRCAFAICEAHDVGYDVARFAIPAELPFGFLRTLKFRMLLIFAAAVWIVSLTVVLVKVFYR